MRQECKENREHMRTHLHFKYRVTHRTSEARSSLSTDRLWRVARTEKWKATTINDYYDLLCKHVRLTGSLHSLASNPIFHSLTTSGVQYLEFFAEICYVACGWTCTCFLKSVGTFYNPRVWFFDCSWSFHDRRDTFRLSLSTTIILQYRCLLQLGCPSVNLCFQSMPFDSIFRTKNRSLKFTARHRSVTSLTLHLVT